MARRIACVVEGHGDIEAVPIVVRRIAEQILPPVIVQVTAPLRTPKSKLVKPGELERAVELAARRVAGGGGVLVVLDSAAATGIRLELAAALASCCNAHLVGMHVRLKGNLVQAILRTKPRCWIASPDASRGSTRSTRACSQ